MNNLRTHILSKIVTILLVTVVLVPSFVKALHVLSHHQHIVCLDNDSLHFHEIDSDCEFYKFKLNNNLFLNPSAPESNYTQENYGTTVAYYNYIESYVKLHFSLRAPPSHS